MKVFFILTALMFFVPTTLSQEHENAAAPQCRAEAAEWNAAFAHVKKIPATEVHLRLSEMTDCVLADPQRTQTYMEVAREYNSELALRFQDFLVRHNLMDKFFQEDASGIR